MKDLNYRVGVLKRKYGLGKEDFAPGTLINKVNSQKARPEGVRKLTTKTQVAIRGLV